MLVKTLIEMVYFLLTNIEFIPAAIPVLFLVNLYLSEKRNNCLGNFGSVYTEQKEKCHIHIWSMFSRDARIFSKFYFEYKLRGVFTVIKTNITTEALKFMSKSQFEGWRVQI